MALKKKPKGKLKGKAGGGGSGGNLAGIALIIGCCAVIGAALWASQFLASNRSFDEATFCQKDGPTGITVVLLDLTDPLSVIQQKRLRVLLDQEIDHANTDRLFSVGVVNEDPAKLGALFARCKPQTGETANTLYENAALISRRYTAEFTAPLHETLEQSLSVLEQNASPIMEALQSLIVETPHFSNSTLDRKIIIVSDMLQNSETLSFYKSQGWNHFTKTNADARLAGNLSRVAIEVFRIPRQSRNTPKSELVDDFWVRYFDKQGTRLPTQQILGDL